LEVGTTYPHPVLVNGFSCRNCSDVSLAEKNIDPAHPQAGPFGVNDPKAAEKSYFSPEARDLRKLKDLHNQLARPVSSIESAYAATPAADSGSFVRLRL